MINNKSINIINNKYFYIFEIDNFLNESFYYDLKKNFPKKEQFEKDNFYYFKNGKLSIESESEVYKNLIKNNETLCKFHNLVNEPFFKKIFFYNLYLKILFSRGFDVKHIIKMIRFPKFTNFNLNKKFSHYLTIFNKIKTKLFNLNNLPDNLPDCEFIKKYREEIMTLKREVCNIYLDYIKESKLEPVGNPEVSIVKIAQGSEFIFKAVITVLVV